MEVCGILSFVVGFNRRLEMLVVTGREKFCREGCFRVRLFCFVRVGVVIFALYGASRY